MQINLSDWQIYYKFSEDGSRAMAQQTYEPLISPDGKTFCANYDWRNEYQRKTQPDRTGYTQEVVEYFFKKEVEYAEKFKDLSWAPNIIDIDYNNFRVYYAWHGETCNEMIYTGKPLPQDWQQQLKSIILEAYKQGVYKLTMYPHCHFFDEHGQMHTIDMYGCVEVSDPWIEAKYMDGIIHSTAQFRLDETGGVINGKYNLGKMFMRSLGEHVKWYDQSMQWIYKEIVNA